MNKYIYVSIVLLLSACSTKSDPERIIEVRSSPIERPNLILPTTSVYKGRPVDWVIITEENVEAKFKNLMTAGKEPVYFSLTASGYENISLNLVELLKILQEQKSVIVAYQNYYERTDRTIRNHNATTQ